MNEKIYLNEENYKKTEKKITLFAIIVLVLGLSLGGFLIYNGVFKPETKNIDKLKVALENKKKELEDKGIKYKSIAKYTEGEVYDLYIITNALDPSFSHCSFDEYKNNSITKEYCSAKNKTSEFSTTSSIMFGGFICVATLMISSFIFMVAKRRKIMAFTAQQAMPVAKETISEIAPSIGEVASEIAKGINNNKDE